MNLKALMLTAHLPCIFNNADSRDGLFMANVFSIAHLFIHTKFYYINLAKVIILRKN